jgi:hypothetical protein
MTLSIQGSCPSEIERNVGVGNFFCLPPSRTLGSSGGERDLVAFPEETAAHQEYLRWDRAAEEAAQLSNRFQLRPRFRFQ